jgi:hypothetical protein
MSAALKATGKPLVLVLMNGRPLALVKEDQQADALLEHRLADPLSPAPADGRSSAPAPGVYRWP